jgi:hypothetical protein
LKIFKKILYAGEGTTFVTLPGFWDLTEREREGVTQP